MVRGNVELEMRLIEDMLDLTKIARGKLTLQLRMADAHELLQSALEIVRSDIEQRHLTPFVALTASRHELIADAPGCSKFFGACCITPANSLPKTARFLCGRTILAHEGLQSRSATMASASNHNL